MDEPRLRTYANNTFEGVWSTGTAAVVWAESPTNAARILNLELAEQGIDSLVEEKDMLPFPVGEETCRILYNGDY